MRKIGRVLLSLLLALVLSASGMSIAAAAPLAQSGTTPPELPFDPHAYGDEHWLGMPSHARCGEDGNGSAELVISLTEDWTGATDLDIEATASAADSASVDTVIWSTTASVEPGTVASVTVPVDERGVRIWVSEEGLSYQGSISSACQDAPIRPSQDGNSITIPDASDLQYYVAPVTVDGKSVVAKWEPTHFAGFFVDELRLEEYSASTTGEIAVPESGLQVVATGPYGVKVQYDWDDSVTSTWTFAYDSDPAVPQTPAAPTQDGNTVLIPSSDAFSYVAGDGTTLTAGSYELEADLVVTAEPGEGFSATRGATTTWAFTYTPEPSQTRPPTTPPAADGPTSADLTAQTRGHTQTPAQATAGDAILVTVGDRLAGQSVVVVLFSTPRELGTFLVGDNGTILVTVPEDVEAGDHRLAVYDGQGEVLGWDPISITLPNLAANNAEALGDPLNATGVTIPFSTIVMAVLLLGAGAAAFVLQRRRDREPSEQSR